MGTGKKKIEIKRLEKEQQRMVTFSKRRQGLFKKAGQLHSLAAASVAVVAFSPAGRPYTHGEPSFGAVVDRYLAKTTAGLKDSAAAMNMTKMSSWLHALQIDGSDDIQELKIFIRFWILSSSIVGSILLRGFQDRFVGGDEVCCSHRCS